MMDTPLPPEPHARILEAFRRVDPHHHRGLFGERERHPAAAAAGVEHPAAHRHPRALEKRDHLRASVILEERVIVLRSEPQVRVRLDGAFVNPAHARSSVTNSAAPPNRICR